MQFQRDKYPQDNSLKNILTINTANSGGGAEKVAYNLCKALYQRGYNATMMVRGVDYAADPLARKIVVSVPGDNVLYSSGNLLDSIFSTQYLFYLPTWKIPLMDCTTNADVIHLHNMHGYYFNVLTLPFLMWQKPVVWTLHDMWSFTGKCAHAMECDRFMRYCGKCPLLSAYPKLQRDTSRFHLMLKKILYGSKNFNIISPSEWLKKHVEKSFLKNHKITVIPSPADTDVFYSEDKMLSRSRLGIPHDKKVLLFVASWVNSIPTKGVNLFIEMLRSLNNNRKDLFTVVVGHLENQSVLRGEFVGMETGFVRDIDTMRTIYNAADIFVSPTLAENSSCTIVESMACGTVPVAFASGGVPEQIVQNKTGLIVPRADIPKLIEAVNFLLDHDEERAALSRASISRVIDYYTMNRFIEANLNVYRSAIEEKNKG